MSKFYVPNDTNTTDIEVSESEYKACKEFQLFLYGLVYEYKRGENTHLLDSRFVKQGKINERYSKGSMGDTID